MAAYFAQEANGFLANSFLEWKEPKQQNSA